MKGILPPEFYLRDTTVVARDLLGKGLRRVVHGQTMLAEIVEVEAYLGEADAASHTFLGKTKRNAAMFEAGGTCYVYLSYGMHFCMNVVTREAGRGEGVLVRAVAPLENLALMARNRGIDPAAPPGRLKTISNGPGKLTEALGVDLKLNGTTYDRPELALLDLGTELTPRSIGTSPRVGISLAADLPLRFYIKDSSWLSR